MTTESDAVMTMRRRPEKTSAAATGKARLPTVGWQQRTPEDMGKMRAFGPVWDKN